MNDGDLSPLTVSVQAAGALLLAIMLAQLGGISARTYARFWSIAWSACFLALLTVRIFIQTEAKGTWVAYLLLEWTFLALLWSGCRRAVKLPAPEPRVLAYITPFAAVIAVVIAHYSATFNELFVAEALIAAFFAFASFSTLGRAMRDRRGNGWRTMRWALAAMGLLYCAYVPLYAYAEHVRTMSMLEYSPLIDAAIAVALGFGMILMTAEDSNGDLRQALDELERTKRRMARELAIDPLTSALNRHAFYSMQRGEQVDLEGVSGVVLMLDIDNLKHVNDTIGHAAGDAVIRAAAHEIRALIRADDLLFRWGGDEFVAVIPNLSLDAVMERVAPLERRLIADYTVEDLGFHLSWGAAEFGPEKTLEAAMREADMRMYRSRETPRAAQG